MQNESTYWFALAHLPQWGFSKTNSLIIKFFHEEKITIEEFFNLPESQWATKYQLDTTDILDLQKAKTDLPNTAFYVEHLISQGYELIPITSAEYSITLKQNLKIANAPPLLYVKGNRELLHQKSLAIVGSRDAESKALKFTDNIAKIACQNSKVVVSGFAKGVDKQALDSALKYNGKSIIVLPQGITTFETGFKTYYKYIASGSVLVLSTFHPKAIWSVGLAMARNPIIYGLADDIFVAESNEKGGTWSGVIDGLKKGRKIFIRQPESNEKNANYLLIQKGATPVDLNGQELLNSYAEPYVSTTSNVNESTIGQNNINKKILNIFKEKPLTAKDILEKANLDWSENKLTSYLINIQQIQIQKIGHITYYTLKSNQSDQLTLFN